jgi:hypothetical protein
MTVTHPHADRDASPAAVTVGTDTYPVDGDGVIDCPADAEGHVADVLAEAYGVDPSALVREEDGPPDDAIPELTYDQLYELARERDLDGRSEMDKGDLIAALEH